MSPDSVTIYQMEVPYNTGIYQEMKAAGKLAAPVADWETKRAWVAGAFAELERAGYTVASAYTAVKNKATTRFVYRDRLWAGADLIGLGVASFGHLQGDALPERTRFRALRQRRAVRPAAHLPRHDAHRRRAAHPRIYSATQAGPDPLRLFPAKNSAWMSAERFAAPAAAPCTTGVLARSRAAKCVLNREGLLQVDRLLHEFFLPEHRNARYA